MKISRRNLAKSLTAMGTAGGLTRLFDAEGGKPPAAYDTRFWNEIHPGVWCATLGIPAHYTVVSSRVLSPMASAFDRLPRADVAPLPAITCRSSWRKHEVELPLRSDEQIFGLALQFYSFAQRGKKKAVRANADPEMDTGNSRAPVPHYVTTAGIGVLINTARCASFYFGDARPNPAHMFVTAASAKPTPQRGSNFQFDDAEAITVDNPDVADVDVYLFAGPTILDAVKRNNAFSGAGVAPPEWGFGRC